MLCGGIWIGPFSFGNYGLIDGKEYFLGLRWEEGGGEFKYSFTHVTMGYQHRYMLLVPWFMTTGCDRYGPISAAIM